MDIHIKKVKRFVFKVSSTVLLECLLEWLIKPLCEHSSNFDSDTMTRFSIGTFLELGRQSKLDNYNEKKNVFSCYKAMNCHITAGQPRGTHARCKPSSLGLNPDPAINCHPGVSQAGWFINVCAVPRMDVKCVSRLPAFVGGCQRSHGVLHKEKASYHCHNGQIPKSFPSQQRAIASTAQPCPQPMMLPCSLVLHMNE